MTSRAIRRCLPLSLVCVLACVATGAAAMQLAQNQGPVLPGEGVGPDNLSDAMHFRSGVWTAYAAPWGGATRPLGSGQYRPNIDYSQGGARSAGFPNNTIFHWSWPDVGPDGHKAPGCSSVCAYNSVAYCDYFRSAPQTPCTPRQVSQIAQLSSSYSYSLNAPPDGADVIYDFFLTDGAGSDKRLAEFEIAVHAPKGFAHYMSRSNPLPGATLCGVNFTAAYNNKGPWPIYLMMPANGQDISSCTMDLLSVLKAAVAQGVVQPDWWFNGLAFGAEPAFGSGQLEIQSLSVAYH